MVWYAIGQETTESVCRSSGVCRPLLEPVARAGRSSIVEDHKYFGEIVSWYSIEVFSCGILQIGQGSVLPGSTWQLLRRHNRSVETGQ
jgi:hypothetical protein